MVTPLKITFPKTREYLWDSSSTGETMDIFAISNNRLKLQIRVSTLKLAVQHCRESGANNCFLLGSAQCSEEELVISVDRFDPGVPTHSLDLGPTDVLEGDIPVRTSICSEEEWQERLPYSERELEDAIETLSLLISQNQQVSLDMFLTLSLCILPLSSPGLLRLRAGSLLSGAHLLLHSIPPVPVLPTALARNLTGPSPIYEVQQRTRSGYLTMDESRRLLLLLDSDPKAPNFPIVGVWVGGASSIQHPAVWASCMQYVCTELLGDRAAPPARGFLLMLYTGGTAGPVFFNCCCQQSELLYSFLSAEASLYPSQEDTLVCDLVSSSHPVSPDSLRLLSTQQKTLSFQQKPVPYPAHLSLSREDSLLNLSLIESVASRTDKLSFCQQVTSSMLLPDPTPPPVLPISPLQTPAPVLSAERTAELLREQQLRIDALQAQIQILLQRHPSPRPDSLLQLTRCSTLATQEPSLPSLHHADLPSFLSQDSSRSSALRELAPCLLALSPPEPDQTDTFLSRSQGSCRSSDASGAQDPIRLFSSEFIREHETHREQTARQQTPSLHSSLLSEPPDITPLYTSPLLQLPAVAPYHTSPVSEPPDTTPLHTSPLLETGGLSSIYIPRIQYIASVGEEAFLSERDPSDQLALKYLEGRSILLDPSVQQLSFIQGRQLWAGGSGMNGISGVSVDTRAYLERHNLAGDK